VNKILETYIVTVAISSLVVVMRNFAFNGKRTTINFTIPRSIISHMDAMLNVMEMFVPYLYVTHRK
jgi:hypothetical protein